MTKKNKEMNYKDKCSKGDVSSWFIGDITVLHSKFDTAEFMTISHNGKLTDNGVANSKLITEAFNVLNETGFTPLEIAEQNKIMYRALYDILSSINPTCYPSVNWNSSTFDDGRIGSKHMPTDETVLKCIEAIKTIQTK